MTIAEFDHFSIDKKSELLLQCCGSSAWVNKMLAEPAFEDLVDLVEAAEEKWYACNEQDWLEAFTKHPEIGNMNSLQEKFTSEEQSEIKNSSKDILEQLLNFNKKYREKFGFIFIVYATGRKADEMLQLLKLRMTNNGQQELNNAAEEQNKITKLRLQKLFS